MKIVNVKYIKDYILNIELNGGESKIINLQHFLEESKHPLIRKYLKKTLFKKVYIDESGVLCWGDNEMDINPESIVNGEFDA